MVPRSAPRLVAMLTALLALAGALPAPPVSGEGGADCDPYPIGRCGDHPRESVVFCYVVREGRYASATEPDAVALGLDPLRGWASAAGGGGHDGELYLWRTPLERFVAAPTTAPLPHRTLWEDSNRVAGLQTSAFHCGTWVWFAPEYPLWIGPFHVIAKQPDTNLV